MRNKIISFLINSAEIFFLSWFIFYNGDIRFYNIVIAWNWITAIVILLFSLFVLFVFLFSKIAELQYEEILKDGKINEAKEKLFKIFSQKNIVNHVQHIIVLFLIAFSGKYVQAAILSFFYLLYKFIILITKSLIQKKNES